MYAQQKRRPLQWENPDMPNADISRLLGEMWRNASPSEKRPHLEREEEERRVYKAKMDKWKNNQKFENAFNPSPSKCRSRGGSTMPKVVALGETTGGEGMKRDRRQDVASLAREGEESHARSGKYIFMMALFPRFGQVDSSPLSQPFSRFMPLPLKVLERTR